MPRPTLGNIRGQHDYQKVYQWEVQFLRLPSGISIPSTDLNFRATTTSIPKATLDQIEVNIRGHITRAPGILRYDQQITMEFVETVNPVIRRFLKQWRDLIWQYNTGNQLPYADITADMRILTQDGLQNTTWGLVAEGVWVQDYDLGQLGSDSEVMRASVTFNMDSFREEQ